MYLIKINIYFFCIYYYLFITTSFVGIFTVPVKFKLCLLYSLIGGAVVYFF